MKNTPTVGIVTMLLGVLVAFIPTVIFPVCTHKLALMNGKALFMKCHWTAVSELWIGILIGLTGILMIGFKKHETRCALSIEVFLLGLTSLLTSTEVIGMCDTATMPCRIGTQPALMVASVSTMVVGIGNLFYQGRYIQKEADQSNGKTTLDNLCAKFKKS